MKHYIQLPEEVIGRHPILSPNAERHVELWAESAAEQLPAYAAEGLSQIPIPVFRWKRGQNIDQTLVDLQIHLFERILSEAPASLHTLYAPVGAYIRVPKPLPAIPEADVVCFSLWADDEQLSRHSVFCLPSKESNRPDMLLDCPKLERICELTLTHLLLMDVGLWLVNDRAATLLAEKPLAEFLDTLNVCVIPLTDAEHYPFTTTSEMLQSTLLLQNAVQDQRLILQRHVKPVPSLFTQNARVETLLKETNSDIWIENSHVPASWTVTNKNVITGVPVNDWKIALAPQQCIRVLPVGDDSYATTVYDYSGNGHEHTVICSSVEAIGDALQRMLANTPDTSSAQGTFAPNIARLKAQRKDFLRTNIAAIASNHQKSVFFQLNLRDAAQKFCDMDIPAPHVVTEDDSIMKQVREAMFLAQLKQLRGEDGSTDEARAFRLLQQGLTEPAYVHRQMPHLDVYSDQIVWGRSAVRIDVAGGWTDTPPYCLNTGGNVVNLAIELNGQQPLQVYVKPCKELKIICRSIDLGATEVIDSYDELRQFNKVGSPFSIPKAALALCGFLPQFCQEHYPTLHDQLSAFGCGLEITLLSAIPAGSGLGTSSILAATVLGALSDFCGLGWDKSTICNRTLILEQLLTTGGGWQDQYGGVLHGVKLLQTGAGFDQTPVTRWLPDQLWSDPEMHSCHLLYYTGITRTAKQILAEIVRGMFLNNTEHLTLLGEMKQQALDMFDAIQRNDINLYGQLVRKTWAQNKALDSGTEPLLVADLCSQIDDLCAGYKLPGAGGGGYLYMVAKDPEAAARIKRYLTQNPLTDSSRFVEMTLSKKGLQVSRS